jgi:hypothetical protein
MISRASMTLSPIDQGLVGLFVIGFGDIVKAVEIFWHNSLCLGRSF